MSTPPTTPTLRHLLSRLAQAKRLFLKPKPKPRNRATSRKKTTTTPSTRQYSLRKRPPPTSTSTTIFTSWRDDDDSTDDDDYDPRIERAYIKRKKALKRAKTSSSSAAASQNGNLSLIVKIKINMESESGKAFLASLGMYQDDELMGDGDNIDINSLRDVKEVFKEAMMMPPLDLRQRTSSSSSCKACFEGGRICSIGTIPMEGQDGDQAGIMYPCEQCIRDNVVCEPIPLPNDSHPCITTTPPNQHTITTTIANPVYVKSEKDTLPTAAVATTITTSLTHPITLTPTPQTCSFCFHPSSLPYSLFGHYQPPRTISVLPILPPGTKAGDYIELDPPPISSSSSSFLPNTIASNPHPHPQTRICVTCALERLRIMVCGIPTPSTPEATSTSTSTSTTTLQTANNHKILPLKGYDPNTFDFEAAYTNLASTSPSTSGLLSASNNLWCSLCPHPAFFGCGRLQSRDVFLGEVAEPHLMGIGCGLLLCERCEVLMRIYKGRVEDVVRRNEEDAAKSNGSTNGGGDGFGGSRADVGFLLKGGWLWKMFMGDGDSLFPSTLL
ncbi:hypothetical protein AbraIFM66951_005753 [Aspergillus brasiliensis]|uniref:Uncharacterized protein n=1 Tax=Aspergillus brasiliensis TaxID=319629 RepID=A0A9W5YGE2_9EURO|nr:hypothetical protein AbraCBS73388_006013 [Aspergillus brasiliensis]GKZ44035.1 hypothetical protein AbraIFM66951_005753 [Aspergillus brasiliensis]